jgi:tetratricopeptide (TPR) repeat protein
MILLEAASRKFTILLAALLSGSAGLAGTDDGTAARAVQLYDDGQYAEACPLVESQEANADGTMLYRLYYCRRLENDPRALVTLEQARKKLEVEAAGSAELLPAFYLANAYSNLGRPTDTRRVATDATRRFEAGKISTPKSGNEMFRLGKLYADQGLEDKAEEWYAKAVSAYAAEPSDASSPYLFWAGRYLADRAFAQQDWERAVEVYGQFLSAGQGTVEDLDHMAVAAVRLGRFDKAAEAWRLAVRLDPANADRPRYCSRLSDRAAELGGLPATAPDDRPWSELSQQELQTILAETASMVAEVQREAAEPGSWTLDSRREAQARIDAAKPAFVAAGLEYALQGYDLREAAFGGGFAPLIFHAKRWNLPPPPPPKKKVPPNERDEETKD